MKKKILIVGAGITGLALAGLLEKGDTELTLIDNTPRLRRKGYGITVMPSGMEVIRSLQLTTKLRTLGTTAKNCVVTNFKGTYLNEFALSDAGIDSVTLNRSDLHALLASALHNTDIKLAITVKKLKQVTSGVKVTFSDATTGEYDLVVGADGVNSIVRQMIFPQYAARKVGAAIWSMMLPKSVRLNDPKKVQLVWGRKQFMGIFPIRDKAAVAFGMPYSTDEHPSNADIKKAFSGLSPLAKDILQHTRLSSVYSSHLRNVKLKHWYKGNIVLAGDAAHTMMPATGMGASIGLQDAAALADYILSTPLNELDTVPKLYEKRRKNIADRVQQEAFMVGKMMLANNASARIRDFVLAKIPSRVIVGKFKKSA